MDLQGSYPWIFVVTRIREKKLSYLIPPYEWGSRTNIRPSCYSWPTCYIWSSAPSPCLHYYLVDDIDEEYNTYHMTIDHLHFSSLRYLQWYLGFSLFGGVEPHSCKKHEIFLMGSYLFPEFDYFLCLPYLFVSQLKRTAASLPVLFDDGSVGGQPIVLGGLITTIVVHCG